MSALLARLQADLNTARKASDKPRTLVLGTILADAKNKKIELLRDLTDDDVVDLVRKSIKRRKESIDAFGKAGRTDLVDKERAESVMLEPYLPPAVAEDDIRTAVRTAIGGGAGSIGAVMGKVLPQFKGKVDGGVINRIAREELATQG